MRRRGFTFLEISVVVFLIILLSSLVLPSTVAVLRSQQALDFRVNLSALMQEARRQALESGRATTVRFGTENTVGWEFLDDPDENATTDEELDREEERTIDQPDGLQQVVRPTESVSFTQFELDRETVDEANWRVGFYPDGTSDQAILEFEQDGQAFVLVVDPKSGIAKLQLGRRDEIEETEWEAGELERRIQ